MVLPRIAGCACAPVCGGAGGAFLGVSFAPVGAALCVSNGHLDSLDPERCSSTTPSITRFILRQGQFLLTRGTAYVVGSTLSVALGEFPVGAPNSWVYG